MDFRDVRPSTNVEDGTAEWAMLVEQIKRIPDLRLITRTTEQRASRELDRLSAEKMNQINLLLRASSNPGGLDYGMLEHRPVAFNPGILKRPGGFR